MQGILVRLHIVPAVDIVPQDSVISPVEALTPNHTVDRVASNAGL